MKEIPYYSPSVDTNGNTYSIDYVRIGFNVPSEEVDKLRDEISGMGYAYTEKKTGPYKYFFKIDIAEGAVIKVGLSYLRGRLSQVEECFMEFNPNKIKCNTEFQEIVQAMHAFATSSHFIKGDLAIDIPVTRSKVMIVKDNRKYLLLRYSAENKTEYLGTRNQKNFVKLYNKKIESGLPEDHKEVTRLEITFTDKNPRIPKVYNLTGFKSGNTNYTSIERELNLILATENPTDIFADLSLYKRRQYKDLLKKHEIVFSGDIIKQKTEFALLLGSVNTAKT